jgi:dTMP kinase
VRRASPPSGDSRSRRAGGGLFIVLEGIDGAGKSEQAGRLAAWLREAGETVVETREPTDGVWGRRYREWARGATEASAEEVLEFFLEDRREHVGRVIRPALARGEVVISDRYRASTRAYQAAQGIDRERLRALFETEAFPEPHLELWLRIPVGPALARLGPGAGERFERAAFLERVDAEYARLGLAEIDAAGSPDEVEQAIRARVEPVLRAATEQPASPTRRPPPRPV